MEEEPEIPTETKKVKGRFQAVAEIDEPETEVKEEPKPVRLGKFQAIVQVSDDEEEEPEVEETKVVVRRPMFTATVEADDVEEEEEEEEEPVTQFQCRINPVKVKEEREESPEGVTEDWELKLQQLKEAFFMFDFNQDGVIDKQDLKQTMAALGQDADPEEIDKMMEEADEPLDFDAFVALFGQRKLDLDPEDILREALSKWDIDNSGLISMTQLRQDLMAWGDKFTAREVDLALEEAPIIEPGIPEIPVTEPMIDYIKFCTQLSTLREKKQ